jgi:hypothetical protein
LQNAQWDLPRRWTAQVPLAAYKEAVVDSSRFLAAAIPIANAPFASGMPAQKPST